MQGTPTESSTTERGRGASLFGLYLGSLLIALVGNLAIRVGEEGGWLAPWAQAALAIAAAVPLGVASVLFWRMLRRDLDEMLQRIVMEGMAIGISIFIPLAALFMNLYAVGVLTQIDAPEVVLMPALFVAAGIWIAARRYE